MNLRPATTADVPQLVALNRLAQDLHAVAFPERFRRDAPQHVVAEAFTAMLAAPSACWFVAEEDGKLFAFLSAEFREREASWCLVAHKVCYLAGIVVAPEHRRRGIARALLAELKREATARGVTQIDLDVWAFNADAQQAFAKLGFQPVMQRMTFSKKEAK